MATESKLVKACLEYLRFHPSIMAWRNNTGGASASYKGKTRYIAFGAPGAPDILGVTDGRALAVECKSPKGKQTEAQRKWQADFEACGGLYILARTLDDLEDGLTTSEK